MTTISNFTNYDAVIDAKASIKILRDRGDKTSLEEIKRYIEDSINRLSHKS